MKIFTSVLLIAAASTALAGAQIDETKPFKDDGKVKIYNLSGSIDVEGWKQNKIEVTGNLGDSAERLDFNVKDNRATIQVIENRGKRGKHRWSGGDNGTNLVVKVPRGVRLHIDSVSADIDVRDVRGEQNLESVSGDVTSHAFENDVQLKSVSGDIRLDGSKKASSVELDTVSGDIRAVDIAGRAEIELVSGDLELTGGAFEMIEIDTVSGDAEFELSLTDDGELEASSVSGEITMRLPDSISAEFDLESFSGRIKGFWGEKATRTSDYGPGSALRFVRGDGEATVRVQTHSGDIEMR